MLQVHHIQQVRLVQIIWFVHGTEPMDYCRFNQLFKQLWAVPFPENSFRW